MALAGTLTDAFPGTTVDAQWSTNGTNTVASAVLTVNGATTANVYGNGGLTSAVTFDGRGTAISVKVLRVASGLAAGETHHPMTNLGYISATGGTALKVNLESSTGNIRFRSEVDYDDPFSVDITYDPAVHIYWRIREASSLTFFETSVDGYNWTLQRTITTPAWLNVTNPNLGVDNKPTTTAQFSSFNILPSPPTGAKLITLTDDFLAPTLDPKWDSSGTTAILSGAAEIGAGDIHSHDQYDLTGSSVAVQVKRTATGGSAITYLNVAETDGSTGTSLRITRDSTNALLSFQVFSGFGDDGTAAPFDITYDSTQHQWWQIWNNTGVTKFQTSPDGTTWTDRRTLTAGTIPPSPSWLSAVSLYLSVDGAPTVTAQYDNVNLPPVPPGTSLAKISTLQDDFATFDTAKWDSYGTVAASGVLDISTNGAAQSRDRFDVTVSALAIKVARVATGADTNLVFDSLTAGTNVRITADGTLLTFTQQVGYADVAPISVTYDATLHAWWRVRETSGSVYLETSLDGSTYTVQASFVTPAWFNTVQVSLAVDGTPSVSAQFDNVNVAPSGGSGPPVVTAPVIGLAATLVDSFSGGTVDTSKWVVTGSIFQTGNVTAVVSTAGSYLTSKNPYDLRESNFTGYVTPSTGLDDETFFQAISDTVGTAIQFIVTGGDLWAKNLVQNIDSTAKSVPWTTTPFWARIKCASGVVSMEYSTTGTAWTVLNSFPAPPWVSASYFRWGGDLLSVAGGASGTGGGGSSTPPPVAPPVAPPVTPPVAGTPGPPQNTGLAPPTGTDITVDFRPSALISVAVLDKWSIGNHFAGLSSPDAIKGSAADVATWKANLKALGPMVWRCPIRWNNGSPGSAAGGAQGSAPDALNYFKAMFEIGGFPYLSIGGNTSDNNMSNSDCSNLIHYFNDSAIAGAKLERICMGNEPDNGGNAGTNAYNASLPGWCAAVKAADSSVLISAPACATGDPNSGLITGALASGANFDILSLHGYDLDKGPTAPATYGTKTTTLRSKFAAAFPSKPVIVGYEEFNQHYDYGSSAHHTAGDDAWNDYRNTVAIAETICQILKSGGHAYGYCDSGDSMGLLANGNGNQGTGTKFTRSPAYWGYGMVTGMNGTFKRMTPPGGGTQMVTTTSNSADLRAFAANNGKVIVVNYSNNDHTSVIGVGNRTAGTYSVWQTNKALPNSPPTQKVKNAVYTNSRITVSFPQGTVTSLDID